MSVRTFALPLVFLMLVLAVPRPVLAQHGFSVSGFIVSIQDSQATFVLQDSGANAPGSVWTVRVNAGTEARRPDGAVVRGPQAILRLLGARQVVEVQGWVIGNNHLLATVVIVRPLLGGDWRDRDDNREIRVAGAIVDLQVRGQGVLLVRERSFARRWGARIWTVRLHPQTRVEGQFWGRDRDPEVVRGWVALRVLHIGDFVEVEGRRLGNDQIQAREITVRARAASPAPFPTPYPSPRPGPYPVPVQTVILTPQQGAEIATQTFTVTGRTVPGAQVRVEVIGRFGVFNMPVTSGTVTANQSGLFVFEVRPPRYVPGTLYTITVTATAQGYTASPVTITVRQQ